VRDATMLNVASERIRSFPERKTAISSQQAGWRDARLRQHHLAIFPPYS